MSLIGRILGAVQGARTATPSPLSAAVGAVLFSAGLALVSRYAAHQRELIGTYQDELDGLTTLITTRAERVTELRAEIRALRAERDLARVDQPYPAADDLNPLHRDQTDQVSVPE